MLPSIDELILGRLNRDDDPELWRAVWYAVIPDFFGPAAELNIEFGCCSHWLRPHQTRWTAGGGFAWPTGYGGSGYSRMGLPLFDWSVQTTTRSILARPEDSSNSPRLRVAIPARSRRHAQAAIHTLLTRDGQRFVRFYGFRKVAENWQLVAVSRTNSERTEDRREKGCAEKHRDQLRRQQRCLKSKSES